MRSRLPWVIAVLLMMVASCVTSMATAWEWSRLDLTALSARQQIRSTVNSAFGLAPTGRSALAARQDLRDEVCIAKSDGQLSTVECQRILVDARRILKPEEYAAFEQSLISMSPEYAKANQSAKIVEKEDATVLTFKESSEPTIPTNVIRPERMAFRRRVW
jgi:hypothetical protein